MLSSIAQATRPVPQPTPAQALIAALLEERRGYLVRGLPDRVALVDEQLAALGHAVARKSRTPAASRPSPSNN